MSVQFPALAIHQITFNDSNFHLNEFPSLSHFPKNNQTQNIH